MPNRSARWITKASGRFDRISTTRATALVLKYKTSRSALVPLPEAKMAILFIVVKQFSKAKGKQKCGISLF
jgi:hypothetical protein